MAKEYTFEAIFERPEVTIEADTYEEAREEAEEQLHKDYRSHKCPAVIEVRER